MSFEIAYNNTMSHEGGYSRNMLDRGGETWKGISRNNWPKWKGWELIDQARESGGRNFPACLRFDAELEDLTRLFYCEKFWKPLNIEQIKSDISLEIFDIAVNMGSKTAGRMFQQALNLLSYLVAFPGFPLKEDGRIGNTTLQAWQAYEATHKLATRTEASNTVVMLAVLRGLKFCRYKEIIENAPTQKAFIYGWVQRT